MAGRLDAEFKKLEAIVAELISSGKVDMSIDAQHLFAKVFAVCAGSCCEVEIVRILEEYVNWQSRGDDKLFRFVHTVAIDKKYFSLFDWERAEASAFFSKFGKDFADCMKFAMAKDRSLAEAVRSFLELGKQRNNLVHNDLARIEFEDTLVDVAKKFSAAEAFLDVLPTYLVWPAPAVVARMRDFATENPALRGTGTPINDAVGKCFPALVVYADANAGFEKGLKALKAVPSWMANRRRNILARLQSEIESSSDECWNVLRGANKGMLRLSIVIASHAWSVKKPIRHKTIDSWLIHC